MKFPGGARYPEALCNCNPIMNEVSRILDDLSRYRTRRKIAAYLLPVVILLFGLLFIFENLSRVLTVTTGVIGLILMFLYTVLVNLNCFKKCPRCGKRFCKDGAYIWCWAKKCLHCNLDLKAVKSTEL